MDIESEGGDVTREEILDGIETRFWLIFVEYILCSVAWIAYCLISHQRDSETLKELEDIYNKRENEQERLLKRYERIQIEELNRNSLIVPSAPMPDDIYDHVMVERNGL